MSSSFLHKGIIEGRRSFLKLMAFVFTMMLIGIHATSKAYAQVKDYLSMRIQSVYQHDVVMKYRKSQDNPSVKSLYSSFLGTPMSEKSEKLLHASYFDRSAKVKGIK
jgi:ferredoxin hydrogenase small subunit